MTFNRILTAAAFAAAASIAAPQAFAQSTASAALANFQYDLVDLNPSDGVTPKLDSWRSATMASATLYSDPDGSQAEYTQSLWDKEGTISLTGGAGAGGTTLAWGTMDAWVRMYANSAKSETWAVYSFRLSPYTRVVFKDDASVNGAMAFVGGGVQAEAYMASVFFDETSGNLTQQRVSLTLDDPAPRQLSVFAETGESEQLITLHLGSKASAGSLTSPVPEPASVTLTAAGLALLLAWSRRRRA
jgi:hypothetical protein